MPAKVVTLRSELKRAISDFLSDGGMSCSATEEALVSLVVALGDYREEERPLFPRILFCDDLESVLGNVQGSGPVQIGSAARVPGTISRALKKCAPLTAGAWAIWVERQDEAFRYGVFREPLPTAVDIRTTLLDTPPSQALRALLIAQCGAGTIEMVSAGGAGVRIHLSGQREEELSTEDMQRKVADWSAADIADERARASYRTFVATALQGLLRKGHGTLIAVVPHSRRRWRRQATDAVLLDEPIDLARQLELLADDPTSLAFFELSTSVELVAGMLSSDGITVFDTRGRVLAFNWFIRTDIRSLSARESMGGARHRAFSALKALVDSGQIAGCYIRSSDGNDTAYGDEV